MAHWVRFSHAGVTGFGTLDGASITVHSGNMFNGAQPTGERLALSEVALLAPTEPTKVIALWNNFHALAAKLNSPVPADPLYLLKAGSSLTSPGAVVHRPASYDGKVVYEGELGIVIGTRASSVSEEEAGACIFGYTCVNDITAADIINKDATFAQWVRAKSFDGFGPFGPVVATDVDPASLVVRTVLNGQERQNYPISDMIFSARQLVSRISHDMTLNPGDVICCGTSVGVGTMKDPSNTVEIVIEGIGTLSNTFVQ
ncbi:2-keto-4-pentenoate hydratase/2-oxohepta-3-ene-1,7-dioic acid hydratase in catechol pathway [Angulomicrobium tetraedrale]|uniref:2-keto-4-pentenoate hydratase/2-oxohepta-3-ene-1,7-dioic acid hydratase in catechol pathway n=1 Tax=Ancylobacter tetraedralis TaxID=217068 RepID=A0A839ZCC8_9HYPH|nr:fumarylacetoacetate hydrolase family protein [Ancylobacter tetraedralis]MBB3772346.1 2-keto-4-pentenoate hydratase/2-oxohepta-3-ene-1,7-dioic acid hydratase in catechol pathway [Ancylobacter tetraedralis]